jgi:hypothetical protein
MKALVLAVALLGLAACSGPDRHATQPPVRPDLAELKAVVAAGIESARARMDSAARANAPRFSVTATGPEAETMEDIVALLKSRGYSFTGKAEDGTLRVAVPPQRVPALGTVVDSPR